MMNAWVNVRAWFYGVLLMLVFTVSGYGAMARVIPLADNTLIEDAEGDVSNGAGDGIYVGRVGSVAGATLRRAVLRFKPSVSIPGGSLITGVSLRLTMVKSPAGTPYNVRLHRVTKQWGEGSSSSTGGSGAPVTAGSATWVHASYPVVDWDSPGGDFLPVSVASASVGVTGNYTWSSPGMLEDVRYWLANPHLNFGWILVGNESGTSQTVKKFASRESSSDTRPVLTVIYTPAAQILSITPVTGGHRVTWVTVDSERYRLLTKTALGSSAAWTAVSPLIYGDGNPRHFDDVDGLRSTFYCVETIPW